MQVPSTDIVHLPGGAVGALTRPPDSEPAAGVLMLHGFGASRDEVGGLFAAMAATLAEVGIGSLRIDFRGFGGSPGDPADLTLSRLCEDAEAALAFLAEQPGIDPARIGLLGFSLGGCVALLTAAEMPGRLRSVATWSAVGQPVADFASVLGREAFDMAARDGSVFLDLGWRTITLRRAFFEDLARHAPAAAAAAWRGPLLMIAGSEDFSAAYPARFAASATGARREAWIIPDADHIFGVLSPGGGAAPDVIARTTAWFIVTLAPEVWRG